MDDRAATPGDALITAATRDALKDAGPWIEVDKGMMSRVLYPNPVCLLSTLNAATGERNVMTITWLTPINNQGGFICSMNSNRHSAGFVNRVGACFVLNVPVEGMEELVLSIGGCSGASVDKYSEFAISCCTPGSASSSTSNSVDADGRAVKKQKPSKKELQRQAIRAAAEQCVALEDCVAHVLCRVDRVDEDDGHLLLRCTQLSAWCRDGYWDGKNFMPKQPSLPSYLTFLGTRVFGKVCRLDR